jgi:hypothetical protein
MDILRDCVDNEADFLLSERNKEQTKLKEPVTATNCIANETEFQEAMSGLFPNADPAVVGVWFGRIKEVSESIDREPIELLPTKVYLAFATVKEQYGAETAAALFNLGKNFTLDYHEIISAAEAYTNGTPLADIPQMARDGMFIGNIAMFDEQISAIVRGELSWRAEKPVETPVTAPQMPNKSAPQITKSAPQKPKQPYTLLGDLRQTTAEVNARKAEKAAAPKQTKTKNTEVDL